MALLAGCTTGTPSADPSRSGSAATGMTTSPGTSTSAPSSPASAAPTRTITAAPARKPRPAHAPRPHLDTWRIGAKPLPLRPDGFGEVLPTPRQLRVRRMPTHDVLPRPRSAAFHGTVGPVTSALRQRMGESWSPSCPVPLSGLRYLTLTFHGFDGRAHTGELVVSASVASDVVSVFRRLYAASYPIEEMRLVTTADLRAPPTGDGNNTAAYVCRAARGSTVLSAHAYGLAIDVNPFLNPYTKGDLVLPELASAYLDRSWRRPGMILRGGVVTQAFAAIGWAWGGDFHSVRDLQHFSANGR